SRSCGDQAPGPAPPAPRRAPGAHRSGVRTWRTVPRGVSQKRSGRAERRNHEAPLGLVALAVRLDVGAVRQVGVDRLPLGGAHRLELDGTPEAERLGSCPIRLTVQRLLAALAVAGGIDHDCLAVVAVVEGGPPGEMLERIDRLAVAADQPAHLVRAIDGR